jgi:hypothetical protein
LRIFLSISKELACTRRVKRGEDQPQNYIHAPSDYHLTHPDWTREYYEQVRNLRGVGGAREGRTHSEAPTQCLQNVFLLKCHHIFVFFSATLLTRFVCDRWSGLLPNVMIPAKTKTSSLNCA